MIIIKFKLKSTTILIINNMNVAIGKQVNSISNIAKRGLMSKNFIFINLKQL